MAKQRTGTPIGDIGLALIQREWKSYNPDDFMPPGLPSDVQITGKKKKPRTWDYPSYMNTSLSGEEGLEPNSSDPEGLTFQEIRQFSENWEIVRLVIETCKDQLSKLNWSWRLIPQQGETADTARDKSEKDPRIIELNKFFARPDKEHNFFQWLRILLEEMLVVDTIAIYRRPAWDGSTYSINIIDAATIKRMVDESGLTPSADLPHPYNIAYQQKIKGMVYAELTRAEMIYFIRNPRVNKMYGYSPIEQIITSINTGIRRMVMQLFHYTEGNIPAMFLRAPVEWTKDQIKEFQLYWNELMTGRLGEMSKGWLIPGDLDPVFPQNEVLKDDFDEWLARIACYAYSVSPNAFIKNLNRATSEQSREQADEEGEQMRRFLIQNIMGEILERFWPASYSDIEFHMISDRSQDSKKQAEIDNIDIRIGVKSVDEVRRERGLNPIGAPNRVYTTNGWLAMTDEDEDKFDLFRQELETLNAETDAAAGETDPKAEGEAKPKEKKESGDKKKPTP